MTIDPFFGNVGVSTHLHRGSFHASLDRGIWRLHLSWFLLLFAWFLFLSPIFDLCIAECLTQSSAKVIKSLLSSPVWHLFLLLLRSSSPDHSEANMSQTHPRVSQSHMCFHLVWLYGSCFMSIAFVFCHHFVLLHLNACSVLSRPHLALDHRPIP